MINFYPLECPFCCKKIKSDNDRHWKYAYCPFIISVGHHFYLSTTTCILLGSDKKYRLYIRNYDNATYPETELEESTSFGYIIVSRFNFVPDIDISSAQSIDDTIKLLLTFQ